MTYNPDRRRVTLFTADAAADLWEFDGVQWHRIFVAGARPSPRLDSAMVYDRERGELVLVGGFGRGENTELGDTWTCRVTTDGTGNVVGSWTRRGDVPDIAYPDEDDASGQMGESGARAEHSLVYDQGAKVVRLFGGKARIVRGSRYQRPYNRENYSAGDATWDGTAWIERRWRNRVSGPTNDPDEPYVLGALEERRELGRKLMGSAYDRFRGRVITYGGLRQIYQYRDDGAAAFPHHNEAYVESMPHLQAFGGDTGISGFPSFSRGLLAVLNDTRCGDYAERRVFGAQLVHDARRDRYVAFGGGYVIGQVRDGAECSPTYDVDISTYQSRLLPQAKAFREWVPRLAKPEAGMYWARTPAWVSGRFHSAAPASRIRHAMAFDEHRGVTVLYGGWDGVNLNAMPGETWEYGPNPQVVGFVTQPPELLELCLGETLLLTASPRESWPPLPGSGEPDPGERNEFQWFRGDRAIDGATNAVLEIPNVGRDRAGQYRCRLTDPCGTVTETRVTTVRVGGKPEITRNPESRSVCPGDDAAALLFFTSDYPATVQWFRVALDGAGQASLGSLTPVEDGASNELRFPSMRPDQNGFYRARVSNRCGEVWTPVIRMTAGVWLQAQPMSTTNDVCTPWTFRVVASGKGTLTYRWRRNGEAMNDAGRISGVEGRDLGFSTLRYLDDAAYDCVVSDACHSVTTRVANLTLRPQPPFVLADTNGPSARESHRMVYDSRRGVTVLFGGRGAGATIPEVYRNDTWEYDGTNWMHRATAVSPSGRTAFGFAFDRDRGRAVLFGGLSHNGFVGGLHNGETWEYDGTNWFQRFPTHAPSARHSQAMFYDPVRKVVTLYGGDSTDPVNPRAGEIWVWDGTDWTERVIGGDRPRFGSDGSPARPQMEWDDSRGYAVLPPTSLNTGGGGDRATWTWDGQAWTRRPYMYQGLGLTPGTAGRGLGMGYDAYRREVVYWGGDASDQAFLWRWNGEAWRRDDVPEAVGFTLNTATAYDARRNSLVQFGGDYSGEDVARRGLSRRTWERVLADTPVLLRAPRVSDAGGTSRIVVSIVAAGAAPVTYRWERDGVALVDGLFHSGTGTAALSVDPVLRADTSFYRCVVRTPCGEMTTPAIRLDGIVGGVVALTAASQVVEGRPGMRLTWDTPGTVLERAPAVTGPWVPVTGATSPWVFGSDGETGFFRLRVGNQ